MTAAQSNKPSVLVIGPVPSGDPGGIATFIGQQLESPLLAERYRLLSLDTTLGPRGRSGRAARLVSGFLLLLRLSVRLLIQRPALVHIHTSAFASFWEKASMTVLCRLLGRKVILHLHSGNFDRFFIQSRAKRLIRAALRLPHRLIVLSPHWDTFFRYTGCARIIIVPNCAAEEFFSARSGEGQGEDIVFVGSFVKEKGVTELLEAMAHLRKAGFTNRLILAGGRKKGFPAWVSDQIKTLSLDRVQIFENLPPSRLAEIMADAALFVLPSHLEGLPIAMLEAMAVGLPVVATPVGGIPDVIEDGINGCLVPVGDSAGLAGSLERLLRAPDLRRRMGVANRQKALHAYHPSVTMQALDNLYRSLTS